MSLKNKFKESGKTLRDIMVVVIGIAITFSLNNWISKRNERKDVQLYLNAVKMELEDNLKNVENIYIYHKEARKLSEYLRSCKPDTYQLDSLNKYLRIIQSSQTFIWKTSAFEMFKMSGTMRLLKDKELLASIWNTYERFEFIKNQNNSHMQKKDDLMFDLFAFIPNDIHTQTALSYLFPIPEFQRYLSFLKVPKNILENFLSGAEQIRETLEAIERIN